MHAVAPTAGLIPFTRLRLAKSARPELSGIKPLQDSIAEHGILVPLLVRPVGANLRFKDGVWDCDHFEVVLGYRRMHCMDALRIAQVLCVIQEMSFRRASRIRDSVRLSEDRMSQVKK